MQQYKTDKDTNLEFLDIDHHSSQAIIMLHGFGASMFDLYSLHQVMDRDKKYDWYFPNAPLELMPGHLMGRAWFNIDMQELELAMQKGEHRKFADKEPSELFKGVSLVESFIKARSSQYDKIILGGFSQGAMVSSHLALNTDLSIEKLILFSGTLIAREKLLKAQNKNRLRFFQSHGKNDPVLEYAQAKELFEALKLLGHTGEFVSFEGAHEIPMEVLSKVSQFLNNEN
ncbi:MAG: esterase [Halobacteriovoraceae bacterium]|nr:esterase [Halobacteriovoraceae bacterium]|tara:strand:- start:5032 stop:5718 length:687 start_codon:yes stop_codon:yes gene_type:complete